MYRNLRMAYVTTPNVAEARKIGKILLEEKLAACVNIVDGMQSMYWWEGEIEESDETVLIIKTHYSRMKKMTRRIKETHSYDCPCVITFTITEDEGNEEYLDWLENTAKQSLNI